MEINVIRFNSKNTELLNEAFKIRTTVFVEEQNVSKEIEYDGLDEEAIHYLVFADKKPIGTGRRRYTEEGIKLERFAVYKEYRGKNAGAKLMEYILNELLPTDQKIYMNAQSAVVRYYEKYGFKIVGDRFIEANIEHYKMLYNK